MVSWYLLPDNLGSYHVHGGVAGHPLHLAMPGLGLDYDMDFDMELELALFKERIILGS